MKQTMLSLIVLFFGYTCANAQNKSTEPTLESKWADRGFWVVENQKDDPKQHTVYYYNADKQLLFKENVQGRRLNIERSKTRRALNKTLVQALEIWSVKQAAGNENQSTTSVKKRG